MGLKHTLKKYSKLECMKVEHLNFGVGVRLIKMDYYQPKSVSSIFLMDLKKGRSVRKTELSQEKTELKTDWLDDVGIHSDMTWCVGWIWEWFYHFSLWHKEQNDSYVLVIKEKLEL